MSGYVLATVVGLVDEKGAPVASDCVFQIIFKIHILTQQMSHPSILKFTYFVLTGGGLPVAFLEILGGRHSKLLPIAQHTNTIQGQIILFFQFFNLSITVSIHQFFHKNTSVATRVNSTAYESDIYAMVIH